MSSHPTWMNCYAKYLLAVLSTDPKETRVETTKMILKKLPRSLDIILVFITVEYEFLDPKDFLFLINMVIECIVE